MIELDRRALLGAAGGALAGGIARAAPSPVDEPGLVRASGASTAQHTLTARAASAEGLSDAAIRDILAARIDRQRNGVGLVVGVVLPKSRQRVGYGRLAMDDRRTPDADTVFEIGSLTKIFTGLLFADMVLRGEIGMDDPLSRHLPGVDVPEWRGRTITLLDLATHTSGLPRFPDNPRLPPDPPKDVFEWYLAMPNYTQADLFAFLDSYKLPREPGTKWEYSNTGFTLLGMALCHRAELGYEALVARRILRPLGMDSTAIRPTPSMARRRVTPHELNLRPAPPQQPDLFDPAGGLLSSANDLMTLLSAVTPGARSPVAAANDLALRTRRPGDGAGAEQAIGWEVVQIGGKTPRWKTGGTRGCSTVMTYDPDTGKGVVVLGNSDNPPWDIARHVLVPAVPLRRGFDAVDVAPARLNAYVGSYALGSGLQVAIARLGDGISSRFFQFPPLALTATSDTAFLNPDTTMEFEFRRDADGKVMTLTLKPQGEAPVELLRSS
jgi:CubicO group peptidase (beta-lactamase class C family)